MNQIKFEQLLSDYPGLAASRRYSREIITNLTQQLEAGLSSTKHGIYTVVAAGSLGRLEAGPYSDVDCIVVLNERADPNGDVFRSQVAAITSAIEGTGLRPPKSDGIYCRPIRINDLLNDDTRGSITEEAEIFGSRMQFLLDARVVYSAKHGASLRRRILQWYATAPNATRAWTHLLNDISRYLHAYAVWQQFKFSSSEDDGWYLRQAKLRTTRVTTFAGLIIALAESATRENVDDMALADALDTSPLNRIANAFERYSDADLNGFLAEYEALHNLLGDSSVREELIRKSPSKLDDLPSEFPSVYRQIHELSESLMDRLVQFMLDRRDQWPAIIFRNILL